MANLTNFAENLLAVWMFKTSTATRPTTLFVAAIVSGATESSIGTEVSGGSYARVQCDAGSAWTVTNNVATNANDLVFPTASGNWGTITQIAICNASTSGDVLVYGSLAASKAISSGDTLRIAAGELTITFD